MGRADYYDHGNPNKICDGCGQKFKASELRETWDHKFMCEYDWERRHPQDTLKSFPDRQSIDNPRPEAVSDVTYWDGSSLSSSTNVPTSDDFLETNEVDTDDLGNGNGTI